MDRWNLDGRSGRRGLAVGLLLLLVGNMLGGGCSGADTSTLEAFCSVLAAVDCTPAVVQACYGASEVSFETDLKLCLTARSQLVSCNPLNLEFHPAYADGCLNEHASAFATARYDKIQAAALRKACLPVLNRNHPQGASCTDDQDCDYGAGLRCVMRATGTGTCQVPVRVEGGHDCSLPDRQCTDEFFCGDNHYCLAAGGDGKVCDASHPCAAGLRCGGGICEAQWADGHSCGADSDCTNGCCVGLGVNGAAGQCAATYALALGAVTCKPFLLQE